MCLEATEVHESAFLLYPTLQTAYRSIIASFVTEAVTHLEQHLITATHDALLPLLCSSCQCRILRSPSVVSKTPGEAFCTTPNVTKKESTSCLSEQESSCGTLYPNAFFEKCLTAIANQCFAANNITCSIFFSAEKSTETKVLLPNSNSHARSTCSSPPVPNKRKNVDLSNSLNLLDPVRSRVKRQTGWVSRRQPLPTTWLMDSKLHSSTDDVPLTLPPSTVCSSSAARDPTKSPEFSRHPPHRETSCNPNTVILKNLPVNNNAVSTSNRVVKGNATAHLCSQCEGFYDALSSITSKTNCLDQNFPPSRFSRHHFYRLPPPTPSGFWDVEFPDTHHT